MFTALMSILLTADDVFFFFVIVIDCSNGFAAVVVVAGECGRPCRLWCCFVLVSVMLSCCECLGWWSLFLEERCFSKYGVSVTVLCRVSVVIAVLVGGQWVAIVVAASEGK